MIWTRLADFHVLQVPRGKAVLTTWANPSYVHGIILHEGGVIEVVPPTDCFASQSHMAKIPGLPKPDARGNRYPSADKAAMAFVEWRLGVWDEPERPTLWDKLSRE